MTLIDEDGDEYPTIYLARKTGLSGGWKGFAVAHDLVDGDALVFQLIRRTAFKVNYEDTYHFLHLLRPSYFGFTFDLMYLYCLFRCTF